MSVKCAKIGLPMYIVWRIYHRALFTRGFFVAGARKSKLTTQNRCINVIITLQSGGTGFGGFAASTTLLLCEVVLNWVTSLTEESLCLPSDAVWNYVISF